MNKITGCLIFLICLVALFSLSVAGLEADINKANEIKAAYEALPFIEENRDYSQEDIANIKAFIDLWSDADKPTKDYVYKEFNITDSDYFNACNLYNYLVGPLDITKCSIKSISDCVFDGTNHTPEITVVNSGTVLQQNKDYSVEYINNKNTGVASVIIKGVGRYYGSVTKTFNISCAKISKASVEPISNKIYTGKRIKPNLNITCADYVLVKDVDYKASFYYNKNVGTAQVIIKGIGNFEGETKATFKINKRAVTKAKVLGLRTKVFRGNAIIPKIRIKLNGKILKEGNDYHISVSGNQKIGNATVRISATGNYKGKIIKFFKIVPAKPKNISYSKSGVLKWSQVQGADKYEICYSNSKNMKRRKVVVVSKNSFSNSKLKGKYVKITAIKKINDVTFRSKSAKIKIQ